MSVDELGRSPTLPARLCILATLATQNLQKPREKTSRMQGCNGYVGPYWTLHRPDGDSSHFLLDLVLFQTLEITRVCKEMGLHGTIECVDYVKLW